MPSRDDEMSLSLLDSVYSTETKLANTLMSLGLLDKMTYLYEKYYIH